MVFLDLSNIIEELRKLFGAFVLFLKHLLLLIRLNLNMGEHLIHFISDFVTPEFGPEFFQEHTNVPFLRWELSDVAFYDLFDFTGQMVKVVWVLALR